MADINDILTDLFAETESEIRSRVSAEINALFPDPITRPDTREGGLLWTLTSPFIKEVARFYSDLNKTLDEAFLPTASGEYLDAKGTEIGLERKEASVSEGFIRFLGLDGVVVPSGTTVSTGNETEEQVTALSFSTNSVDEDGNSIPAAERTVEGITDPDVPATVTLVPGSGNISGDVIYKYTWVTALKDSESAFGETAGSTPSLVLSATSDRVDIEVPAPPTYSGLYEIKGINIYRALNDGTGWTPYKLILSGLGSFTGGFSTSDNISNQEFGIITKLIPTVNTTGFVDIKATSDTEGAETNIVINRIKFLDDPISGIFKVTNPEVFSGGSDVEDDEEYRERLLEEVQKPSGAGNISDYIGWAKEVVGVEAASVIPEWEQQFGGSNGPGTVKVIVSGPDNQLINNDLVEKVRQYIAGDVAVDSPYKYLAGSTKPSLDVVNALGGNINDANYEYVYSYVNVGGGETPHNAIDLDGDLDTSQVLTVTVSSGTGSAEVVLEDIQPGPSGTSVENTIKRRIYRRNANSVDTKFYLVGEINDNFTTTFTDSAETAGLRFAPSVNSTSMFNGKAPIGAHVTVETISKLTIRVEGIIVPKPGYNLLGTGGNINLNDLIDTSLTSYFNSLNPGDTIYYVSIQNAIHDTEGVRDFRNIVIYSPDFPFGTTENIENLDKTVKPIYDASGTLIQAAE